MWNFRSEKSVRSWKSTNTKKNERALSKPSPISRWLFTMGLANVPSAKAVLSGILCVFRKPKWLQKDWQRIIDYELEIWELLLREPRFPTPKTFLGNRLKFGIFTDACAKSPSESDSINWASGVGVGGILVVSGGSRRIPLAGSEHKNSHTVRRTKISPQAYKFLRTSSILHWYKTMGPKPSRKQGSILAWNPNSYR